MEAVTAGKTLRIESRRTVIHKSLMCALAVVIGLLFLFPLYWLLMMSFKGNREVLIISFVPLQPTLGAWREQLSSGEFLMWVKNSFLIAFLSMALSFMLGVTAAYGLARFRIPGKNVLLLVFLVTQMMPASLILTPLYLTYSKMGLLNTYLAPALAVTAGTVPFVVVTLRPYFLGIPKSLEEAARIDGCGPFRTFITIMIPIIQSGLVTIVVISFLNGWNDLVYSMTFNVSESMRPLTANINKFMSKYGLRWNGIMAYGMILIIPVTLAFVFLQKYIVGGLTSGAVKE